MDDFFYDGVFLLLHIQNCFDHDNNPSTGLVAIVELTGTDAAELNNCYFATTAMSSSEFDAVSGDLFLHRMQKRS